jgi:RHS repeat-associated protein
VTWARARSSFEKQTTRALGGTTSFGYDVFGNLTEEEKVIGSHTHVTAYSFDEADSLESITYPSGRTVEYTRNVLGQVETVETTYGASTVTVAEEIEYRPFGPLSGLTFGNNLVLARTFDQQYRLTDQTTGSIQELAFTLDAAGNIDAIADGVNASLTQTFTQDALHRIDSEEGAYGVKDYSYDAAGNRLSRVHYPGSGSITQTLAYVSGLSEPDLTEYGGGEGGGGGGPASTTNGTLVMGVNATLVEPSATVTLGLANVPSGSYHWLALAVSGAPATSYLQWRYVGSGADWTVTMPSTEQGYEFRFFLNNGYTLLLASPTVTVSSSAGGGGPSIPYGGESNRLATHDGQTVTLDDAGNTTADPAEDLSFTYDDHNRMVEAYVDSVLQASYVYNGQGQRVKKIEATGAERTIVYHYGLSGELLGETIYSEAGSKIGERDYLWLDSLPLAQSEREFSGSTITGQTFVYLHGDQLNTPRLATDATGEVVWRWDSDAFGVGEADLDPDSDTEEVNVRLRYPGQYWDEETGLHYNYFRDYDPVTGRYVESDPIGLGGGPNTFAYVNANPITYVDPKGLFLLPLAPVVVEGLVNTVGGLYGLYAMHQLLDSLDEPPRQGAEIIPFPRQTRVEEMICRAEDPEDPCMGSWRQLKELHTLIRDAEARFWEPTGIRAFRRSRSTR